MDRESPVTDVLLDAIAELLAAVRPESYENASGARADLIARIRERREEVPTEIHKEASEERFDLKFLLKMVRDQQKTNRSRLRRIEEKIDSVAERLEEGDGDS
jgi:hydrogenase maturation factor HypF (carbamoyltransferase family)